MFNKFLIILTISSFIFAMQNLRPWVQQAVVIQVRNIEGKYQTVAINDQTTVLDVKKYIYEMHEIQGISAGQQVIYPFKKIWWGLSESRGPRLDNQDNIKQVMNDFDTDLFQFLFKLRKKVVEMAEL